MNHAMTIMYRCDHLPDPTPYETFIISFNISFYQNMNTLLTLSFLFFPFLFFPFQRSLVAMRSLLALLCRAELPLMAPLSELSPAAIHTALEPAWRAWVEERNAAGLVRAKEKTQKESHRK